MTQALIDLLTKDSAHRIALRGIHLSSRLTAMGQRTTVAQTFINLEEKPVEVLYTFPLPEQSAVCGFDVVTADRVLTGQVEDAEKAIELYDDALRVGHGAYLLEGHRPDVFTINVGNLKPGQAVTVRITYVSDLEMNDGCIRLAFPTVVAPRYATATATDPLTAVLDAEALNPPHLLEVPYGLTMEVDVALGRPIKSILSPSHAITYKETVAEEYQVRLTAGITETNREIVLEIDLGPDAQPRVEAAVDAQGRHYLAVTFVPEFDAADLDGTPAGEVIFVLDCSGSMEGDSIAQAKIALGLCLRHLSEGDKFNICRFGSTYEWFKPSSITYTQTSLDEGLAYLAKVNADLGGTELHAPLAKALGSNKPREASDPTVHRQVIVLTDGQVSNEPALISLARKHRTHNRIFAFGIGPACSRHLVRGLAEATGGVAEFVGEGERIEEKVLRTFSRIASPAVTDVTVDWDGRKVEQTPQDTPPVFDGDTLTVSARCVDSQLPTKVALKCRMGSGPAEWSLHVPAPTRDAAALATLWARRRLVDLELAAEDRNAREQCIALSHEYGVLCTLTSFVAVEHRSPEERAEGRPEVRRIPVAIPRGWHGINVARSGPLRALFSTATTRFRGPGGDAGEPLFLGDFALNEEASTESSRQPADKARLLRLMSHQQADGSFTAFDPTDVTDWRVAEKVAESWLRDLPAANQPKTGSSQKVSDTLAVLWLLQARHAAERRQWLRAQRKAIRFVSHELGLSEDEVRALLTS